MPWTRKRDVFEKSYDEVLTALKHQDDKLNRTLTAIAFLTAAGVAIYASLARALDTPVRFAESGFDATAVFFLIFLVSVLIALLLALSAIGPSAPLPALLVRTQTPKKWPSLLFWAQIVKDKDWDQRVDAPVNWLEECLARNLHDEAETIARRVNYKVARSRESGAFVQLAVLSLVLLGIFSTESVTLETRWWVASAVLLGALVLPLWDLSQMAYYRFHESVLPWESYVPVVISVLFAGFLLGGARHFQIHWWAVLYAVAAILASRLAYVNRRIARVLLPLAAVSGPVVTLIALLA